MAGTSGVGYCRLVMEDASGKTLRGDDDDFYIICRAGRPDAGNWIHLPDLGRFFVDRVEFMPESGVKMRNNAYPVLYLRAPGAPRSPAPGGGGGRSPHRPLFPSNHDGSRNVIPFERPGSAPSLVGTWLLPPSLVANLVAVAYREQASDFDDDRRVAATLLRTTDGELLRPTLPAVFGALSREAKRAATQCLLYFGGTATANAHSAEAPRDPPAMGKLLELHRAGDDWVVTAA